MHVLVQLEAYQDDVGEPLEAYSAVHQLLERCAVHRIMRSQACAALVQLVKVCTKQSKNPGGLPAALDVLDGAVTRPGQPRSLTWGLR